MARTYLTPEDLSARWNLPLSTLNQWRWNGKPPAFAKIGKRVRYELKDVEEFEEKFTKKNTCYKEYPAYPQYPHIKILK